MHYDTECLSSVLVVAKVREGFGGVPFVMLEIIERNTIAAWD